MANLLIYSLTVK